jgi:hypothetical protein
MLQIVRTRPWRPWALCKPQRRQPLPLHSQSSPRDRAYYGVTSTARGTGYFPGDSTGTGSGHLAVERQFRLTPGYGSSLEWAGSKYRSEAGHLNGSASEGHSTISRHEMVLTLHSFLPTVCTGHCCSSGLYELFYEWWLVIHSLKGIASPNAYGYFLVYM